MIFSLDVQPARKGDCLLLHWGSREDLGLVLIDGGPASVYGPHLSPRLRRIGETRPDPDTPLLIDLLMVSHIDDDHIHGVLELATELEIAKEDHRRPSARVASCWHNAFDDLVTTAPEDFRRAITAQFGAAAVEGVMPPLDGVGHDAAEVLASLGQGHRLRHLLRKLEVPLNPQFREKLVVASAEAKPIDLGRGLTLRVVGPMRLELEALRAKFAAWLKATDSDRRSTEATLAAFSDQSVPNLSSIVVLAEAECKRVLLTGDARGDKILEGLNLIRLLSPEGHMHVNALKVPHHGSANNMDIDFFRRVTADHYVFSGDGQHGNPERETLAMLFEARPRAPFTVHLTYPLETIDAAREREWEKQLRQKHRAREWRSAEDSLASFLEARDLASRGQRVCHVSPKTAHVIDLLEPLGF